MKFFISYCDDGEGLVYARKAKEICKNRNIEAWVWHDDANTAKWLKTDIAESIESSTAMLTIVTTDTGDSEPQKGEWSLADSLGKMNSSLRKKGFSVPLELRGRRCPEFSDNDFIKICSEVINNIVDIVESSESNKKVQVGRAFPKISQLSDIKKQLERNKEGLDEKTITEFRESVWEGYLGSTVIRNIVKLAEVSGEDENNLVKIAIRSNIDLDKFNAKDYWWEPAFRQLGREIATGEKRFLAKNISEKIKEIDRSCNEKDDELSIILKEIERLKSIGHMPDIILAPPSMLKSFAHFFNGEKGNIDFTRERGNAAMLKLKDSNILDIYLFGGGILSENLIITNRSNIIWKFIPDPDTRYALTAGIGRGPYPDKVAFILGTSVRCILVEKEGITRIPIER